MAAATTTKYEDQATAGEKEEECNFEPGWPEVNCDIKATKERWDTKFGPDPWDDHKLGYVLVNLEEEPDPKSDVGHYSNINSDEMNKLLGYLELPEVVQMCGVNRATYNVSAIHPHWRLFVVQGLGIYYDDYMNSIQAVVKDPFRWRRLFIYGKQVHRNLEKRKCKQTTHHNLLRGCGVIPDVHGVRSRRRRLYRGTVELADDVGTVFWDNGSVIQQVQASDGRLIREFETGQTFKHAFPRVASVRDHLFVCLNDCIQLWDLSDAKKPPKILKPLLEDVPRRRKVGKPVELLTHRQKLILLKKNCSLIWNMETLKFVCSIWHVDDVDVNFGRAREIRKENAEFDVMWMGNEMVTWNRHISNFVNVWSLSDGSRVANLKSEEPILQVDVARVTWVSTEIATDHFVIAALDEGGIVTLWNSNGFNKMYRFYGGCAGGAFDLVLTQDFLGIATEKRDNNFEVELHIWKLWFHPGFVDVDAKWRSTQKDKEEATGFLKPYEYQEALIPFRSRVDREAVRDGQRARDSTVAQGASAAGSRINTVGGRVMAMAALRSAFPESVEKYETGPEQSLSAVSTLAGDDKGFLLNFDCRHNAQRVMCLRVPSGGSNLPFLASFRNFLIVSHAHKKGNESLSLWRSDTLGKLGSFGALHEASHVKFEEWLALEIKSDGDAKATLRLYDFRPLDRDGKPLAFEDCRPECFLGENLVANDDDELDGQTRRRTSVLGDSLVPANRRIRGG
jgi:hypothetical protein